MDNVEFDREPPANLTTLVIAFGGWIDAGRAATGALRHLVSDLPAARLARIDPEEFFVFGPTKVRPVFPRSSWTRRRNGESSTSASWAKRRTICKAPRIRRRSRPW